MAEYPAMPLLTDAYIADTQHLTNEEHGIYLRLLMFAWRTTSGTLPDDDKRLGLMVGMTRAKWLKHRPTIVAFFTIEDGKWYQKKLKKQREFVSKKVHKASLAGIASAEAKALKRLETASTDVDVELQLGANNHNHNHNHKKETPIIPSSGDTPKDLFPETKKTKAPRAQKETATAFPEGWKPSDAKVDWAISKGFLKSAVERMIEACVLHHRSKGTKFVSHEAAFQTWVLNQIKFHGTSAQSGAGQSSTSSGILARVAKNYGD